MAIKEKYFIIYKIIIIETGQFYIGKHVCYNPYDQYFGSSEYVKNYIKENGMTNIRKEILTHCEDEEQMAALEGVHIAPHFNNPLCLNKVKGMSIKKYAPLQLMQEEPKTQIQLLTEKLNNSYIEIKSLKKENKRLNEIISNHKCEPIKRPTRPTQKMMPGIAYEVSKKNGRTELIPIGRGLSYLLQKIIDTEI